MNASRFFNVFETGKPSVLAAAGEMSGGSGGI